MLRIHPAFVWADESSLRLSDEPLREWKRILFYRPRWVGGDSSVVDDPRFFLASDGKGNPDAELQATASAWVQTGGSSPNDPDRSIECRFPARMEFIRRRFPEWSRAHPRSAAQCPRWDQFRNGLPARRISFVFSSYYPSNAGSLFGHTLLRFHLREAAEERPEQALLDIGVNYAAYVDTGNPIAYAVRGIGGGFAGGFSVLPYYLKIQEYNNSESRDLWEYELDLTPAQVDRVIRSLWEVGQHDIRYWYLDENCALLILQLLETADPAIDLTATVRAWVIPSDGVRRLRQGPSGFVRAVRFRPSNLLRYEAAYARLNPSQRRELREIIEVPDSKNPVVDSRDPAVLDAVVDWIDFSEKVAGSSTADRFAPLRRATLLARSRMAVASPPVAVPEPIDSEPSRGLGPVALGLGVFTSGLHPGPTLQFRWRPAFNDLAIPGLGNPGELEVRFMEFLGRSDFRRIWLEDLTLLRVTSLSPWRALLRPLAWRMDLGLHRGTADSLPLSPDVSGEIGGAFRVGDFGSAMLGGELRARLDEVRLGFPFSWWTRGSRLAFAARFGPYVAQTFPDWRILAVGSGDLGIRLREAWTLSLRCAFETRPGWECGSEGVYSF